MFTTEDPRPAWSRWVASGDPTPPPEVSALVSGAREVPLDWLFDLDVKRSAYFDRDTQEEYVTVERHVRGWRAAPDPRARFAGLISLDDAKKVDSKLLRGWPRRDDLDGIRALSVRAGDLTPAALEHLGRAARLEDLAITGSHRGRPRWSELVPALGHLPLRGFDLADAKWSEDDAVALAQHPFFERLDELCLSRSHLGDAARRLGERAGRLLSLDLCRTGLDAAALGAWVDKLSDCERLVLSDNRIGDAGIERLIEGGALDAVEDLWIGDCGLSDVSVERLCEARPAELRGLWLHNNALTPRALDVLASSALLEQLTGLGLYGCGLDDAGPLAGHALEGALRGTTRLPGVSALVFLGRPRDL
ncbi:MAG: hypothetical protein H6722_26625 [Sandaracinus sp.]|nr:hypothetical protein [Sandaracinus sp.]MCB9625437.1 hypothetical protein [Sandaracinus sp.]